MTNRYVFEYEARSKWPSCENELTSNVFGTLHLLGSEAVSEFLRRFLDIEPSASRDVDIEFWRTFEGARKSILEKKSREPDVAISDSQSGLGVFIECKLDDDPNYGQLHDELTICEDIFEKPFLLLVSRHESFDEDIQLLMRESDSRKGTLRTATWKSIRTFFSEIRESLAGGSSVGRKVVDSLISLLSDYGFREMATMEIAELARVTEEVESVFRFLKEVEILSFDLEEALEEDELILLKQEGGGEIERSKITSKRDAEKWILWKISFQFVHKTWYDEERYSFDRASNLYVNFRLDEGEYYVGYWGQPDTFGTPRKVPLPPTGEAGPFFGDDMERLEDGFAEMFLGSEDMRQGNLDIYYVFDFTNLARGKKEVVQEVRKCLLDIKQYVETSGLRK